MVKNRTSENREHLSSEQPAVSQARTASGRAESAARNASRRHIGDVLSKRPMGDENSLWLRQMITQPRACVNENQSTFV
jgi:hypothetical protein